MSSGFDVTEWPRDEAPVALEVDAEEPAVAESRERRDEAAEGLRSPAANGEAWEVCQDLPEPQEGRQGPSRAEEPGQRLDEMLESLWARAGRAPPDRLEPGVGWATRS